MNKKNSNILYWATTCFVVFVCTVSGMMNIIGTASLREANRTLGLPFYLSPFFGILKILGVITIITPFFKRFHEAAYAGLVFYFIGASYVLMASGGGIEKYGITLVILAAVIMSYLTYLRRMRLLPKTPLKAQQLTTKIAIGETK